MVENTIPHMQTLEKICQNFLMFSKKTEIAEVPVGCYSKTV